MSVEKLNTLENRIEKPAYLLLIVVVLIFFIVGFVDLLDHTNSNPVIFNRYSIPYFLIIAAYTIAMIAWASLLRKPNDDRWLRNVLDYIQLRPILAVAIMLLMIAVFLQMMTNPRQLYSWPALEAMLLVGMLLFGGLLLFYHWGDETRPRLWRKFFVYPLIFLLFVELVIQVMAYFGALPNLSTRTESLVPYSRVYQTEQGFGNGLVNNFGRYYPPFRLLPDSKRILLIGDSYIQALQVEAEENLGVSLEEMINGNQSGDQIVEILALGEPDYGPGLYLSEWMLETTLLAFEPDEAILVFDLGNDFQTVTSPEEGEPYFIVDEDGRVVYHPDTWGVFHKYEHNIFRGYEGYQFVRFFKSHYLTPRVISHFLGGPAAKAEANIPAGNEEINLPNSFVFNEETNDEAMVIATGLIKQAQEQYASADVPLRLVTVPAFTEEFYEQDEWNTQFGNSDLLLPERELRAFAAENDIKFLGLGAYLGAAGMSPNEIRSLFFNEGLGYFTPEGHDFVAEAFYHCFFEQSLAADMGCDIP